LVEVPIKEQAAEAAQENGQLLFISAGSPIG